MREMKCNIVSVRDVTVRTAQNEGLGEESNAALAYRPCERSLEGPWSKKATFADAPRNFEYFLGAFRSDHYCVTSNLHCSRERIRAVERDESTSRRKLVMNAGADKNCFC